MALTVQVGVGVSDRPSGISRHDYHTGRSVLIRGTVQYPGSAAYCYSTFRAPSRYRLRLVASGCGCFHEQPGIANSSGTADSLRAMGSSFALGSSETSSTRLALRACGARWSLRTLRSPRDPTHPLDLRVLVGPSGRPAPEVLEGRQHPEGQHRPAGLGHRRVLGAQRGLAVLRVLGRRYHPVDLGHRWDPEGPTGPWGPVSPRGPPGSP